VSESPRGPVCLVLPPPKKLRMGAARAGRGRVKTMFRFNPSSPNKDECCGWGWLPRILEVGKPRLRSGDHKAKRLSCVDEEPFRGFPRVTPVLRFKA
jgi:hypothetical protein